MAHGHDDTHDPKSSPAAGHADSGGHDAGHADAHGGGGHGHAQPPPEPQGPPPAHEVTIARGARWLGLLLWAGGFLATLWTLFLWYRATGPGMCVGWAAFASVYGFCVWLAARETITRSEGSPA